MDDILKGLNEKRARARLAYLLHSVVLLTIVVMIFQGQYTIVLGLAVLALILYLFMVRWATRDLNESFTRENNRYILSRHLSDFTYEARVKDRLADLREDHLLPLADKGLLTLNHITGRAGDIAVELMDVTTPSRGEGLGKAKFLTGAWIRMRLPENDHQGKVRAYSEDLYTDYDLGDFAHAVFDQAPTKRADPVEQQQILWLWSTEARAQYSAARQEVEALARYTPGDIAIALNADQCSVFIQRRFLAGRGVSLKTPITAEKLSFDHFPEIEKVLNIGRALLRVEASDTIDSPAQ